MLRIWTLALCGLFMWAGEASAANVKDVVFSELERRAIEHFYGKGRRDRDWEDRKEMGGTWEDHDGKGKGKFKHAYKTKGKGLPPGLAKRQGNLPPGLAMQLQRRGKLPPGLAKRQLPRDLLGALPPAPEGTERAIVDNDVILIQTGTGIILDILHDVVTR